jgi:predicted regulator of Ras-like GTPase activity (Roadblock/LC7/MglB family)
LKRSERSWAREAPRDQEESAFTPILRGLLHRTSGVLAVAFVDEEGECVDYASVLSPFDAKIIGAQMRVVLADITERFRAFAGHPLLIEIQGDARDILVRPISDDYSLVVAVSPRAVNRRLLAGMERAALDLRREAGIDVAPWEPVRDTVRVELREAIGWSYAPAAFLEGGARHEIDDVLGRWTEGTGTRNRICFRVRTRAGEELTLVHDRALDRWERQVERQ